jgi:hypothetical protein
MPTRYLFLPRVLVRVVLRFVAPDVFRDVFRAGTFAPFARASLKPIAMACFRLVTLRPDPLLSVPFFFRRTADSTRFEADRPYLAIWFSSLLNRHSARLSAALLQTVC